MDNYFKNPVHEVVAILAATGTPGHRVICEADWFIYEYDANGIPVKDDTISLGAMCSVIGNLGDENKLGQYVNGSTFAAKLSLYFPAGNTMNVTHCIMWGDRLVVSRTDTTNGDIIIFFPNGNTYKQPLSTKIVKCMTVDSRANLWIGMDTGLARVQYDDTIGAIESFSTADGLPDDCIDGLCAVDEKVWIITAHSAAFFIAQFDGNAFVDYTAQFETDTAIDVSGLTGCLLYRASCPRPAWRASVGEDNTFYFSMYSSAAATGTFFYFNATTAKFGIKALPTAFTGKTMTDFAVIGNYVYSIKATTGAAIGGAGVPYIWKYSDLTEIFVSADVVCLICFNTNYVVMYSATKIFRTSITANSPAEETDWEAQIAAIAPGSKSGVTEIACDNETYLFVCNETTYNDILTNAYGLKWVVNQL
jgi:hypothetical protein